MLLPELALGAPEAAQPDTIRCICAGNGGCSGWPLTKCFGGTGISVSRPGRACSGVGMTILSISIDMAESWILGHG